MNLLDLAGAALAEFERTATPPTPDPGDRCPHWEIHFTDREPLEVIFAPALTLGEALAIYPAAVAALPWVANANPANPANEPEPAEVAADRFQSLPTCEQCRNLGQRDRDGFRRCAAAARGELPHVASRRYSPVPDLPRRCEGFRPHATDPDQRTGAERWPGLTA